MRLNSAIFRLFFVAPTPRIFSADALASSLHECSPLLRLLWRQHSLWMNYELQELFSAHCPVVRFFISP